MKPGSAFPGEVVLNGLLPAQEPVTPSRGPELGQGQDRPQQVRQVVPHPVPDLQDASRSERRPIDAALPDVASERAGLLIGVWKRHVITVRLDADTSLVFTRIRSRADD